MQHSIKNKSKAIFLTDSDLQCVPVDGARGIKVEGGRVQKNGRAEKLIINGFGLLSHTALQFSRRFPGPFRQK